MRALKVFVVVAGAALVLGTAFLVYELFRRGTQAGRLATDQAVEAATVATPPGTHVQQIVAYGDRLGLLVADQSGRQWLIIIDPATGRAVTEIRILPAGDPDATTP